MVIAVIEANDANGLKFSIRPFANKILALNYMLEEALSTLEISEIGSRDESEKRNAAHIMYHLVTYQSCRIPLTPLRTHYLYYWLEMVEEDGSIEFYASREDLEDIIELELTPDHEPFPEHERVYLNKTEIVESMIP